MKTVDFSETFAACDLKVVRSRQLIEFMNVCECHFLTQVSYILKLKPALLKRQRAISNQILYVSFSVQGKLKFNDMVLVT